MDDMEFADWMIIGGCAATISVAGAIHLVAKVTQNGGALASEDYERLMTGQTEQELTRPQTKGKKKKTKKPQHPIKERNEPFTAEQESEAHLENLVAMRRAKTSSVNSETRKQSVHTKQRKHKKTTPRNEINTAADDPTITQVKPVSDSSNIPKSPPSQGKTTPKSEPNINKHTNNALNKLGIPLPDLTQQHRQLTLTDNTGDSQLNTSMESQLAAGNDQLQTVFDMITRSGFSRIELQALVGVATAQQEADYWAAKLNKCAETNTNPAPPLVSIEEAATRGLETQLKTLKQEQERTTAQLVKENSRLRTEVSSHTHQQELLSAEKGQLITRLTTIEGDYSNKINKITSQYNELKLRESLLQTELSSITSLTQTLRTQLQTARAELEQCELLVKSGEISLNELRLENSHLHCDNQRLSSSLGQVNSEKKVLERTVSNQQQQIHIHSQNIKELESERKVGGSEFLDVSTQCERGEIITHVCNVEHVQKLEKQIQQLKDKNNELRRKNWGLTEIIDSTEKQVSTLSQLEQDLERKSALIHELKASNQSLKRKNIELSHKLDDYSHVVSDIDEIKRERSVLKHQVSSCDEEISRLETALLDERQQHVATEQECRTLIETQLPKSLSDIENKHKHLLEELQYKLDQSEKRVEQLEQEISESQRNRTYFNSPEDSLNDQLVQSEKRYFQLAEELQQLKQALESSTNQESEN